MLETFIMKYINECKRYSCVMVFHVLTVIVALFALLVSRFALLLYRCCLGKETGIVSQQVLSDISDGGKSHGILHG